MSTEHLACSYAVLLLQDEGLPINAVNINKLIENARITGVEKFYAKLYASNITPAVIASTIAAGGSTTGAAAGASAAAPAAKSADKETKAPGNLKLFCWDELENQNRLRDLEGQHMKIYHREWF